EATNDQPCRGQSIEILEEALRQDSGKDVALICTCVKRHDIRTHLAKKRMDGRQKISFSRAVEALKHDALSEPLQPLNHRLGIEAAQHHLEIFLAVFHGSVLKALADGRPQFHKLLVDHAILPAPD